MITISDVGQTLTAVTAGALQKDQENPDVSSFCPADMAGGLRKFSLWKVNRLKVVIADDSNTLRERLIEMLSRVNGVEIVGEADGVRAARQAIRDFQPDLVILDIQMPDGSGLEVLRRTKQAYPNTKVIIFTNQPEVQYQRRCSELGADYFLCKSTDLNLLIEISEKLATEGPPQ